MSDSEESELDEEEFLRQQAARKAGSRKSVAAEKWNKSKDWKAPVHKKTPEQLIQIKAACTKSFMFAALPQEMLDTVLDAFDGPHEIEPKSEVIKQGAEVVGGEPGLYIIESGTLDAFKTSSPDDEHPGKKVFSYDTAGQSFGELALLYNCPRAATVIASTKSVIWSIDRDTFNNCVKGAALEMQELRDEFLSSVEILKSLTPEERGKIRDVMQPRDFKKGDKIITQGETGLEFFLIAEGSAHAEQEGKGRVEEYSIGSYFGELSTLRQQARAASVIADETPTKAFVLDGISFKRLLGTLEVAMNEKAKAYEATEATGGYATTKG